VSDLNIHLDVVDDRDTRRLAERLDTFGLSQLVSVPTHRDGHTLDAVITRADSALPVVDVRPSDEYSDHSLVLFQLPLHYVDVNTRGGRVSTLTVSGLIFSTVVCVG